MTVMMNAQDIRLPEPNRTGGKPLMDALNERCTKRDYSDKMLTEQQLSDLLWAACGVNREDGRRTAPTARNCQQIDVYVYTEKGVYLYVPGKHILQMVVEGDFRAKAAMQPFAAQAPVLLVFVANYDKMKDMDDEHKALYGATDTGNISQNVYLYCASEGLATVALGSIYRDEVQKLLKFNGKAILGQSVAYPK